MTPDFQLLNITRKNFLHAISGLSIEQLNTIPAGFNNNIIWNFGHVIVTQQLLCYQMAGLELKVEPELTAKYRKGTKPESFISGEELQRLKDLAFPLLKELEQNYRNNEFTAYKPYETSYGAELKSIEDAVEFVIVHEALHYGYVMALKHALK